MKSSEREFAEGILFTDMYQLTMAQLYYKMGMHELDAQFDALRPVARLRGLESEALAPGVEEQLEEALR